MEKLSHSYPSDDVRLVNADNIDITNGKSLFITGQTGSGKSYLVHKMIESLEETFGSELKYALFDLKQIEFQREGVDYHSQYLLFGVVTNSELGLERLEYLARIASMRLRMKENLPRIFIYIEECDMAYLDQQRFDKAVIAILEHAHETHMQLVYTTSRPSHDTISKNLLKHFDRVLLGNITGPITQLGTSQIPKLPSYSFIEL